MVVQVQWLGFELQCFQTGHFEYALKTAEQPEQQTAFERCFGKDLFSFLRENDTERELFTSGMKAQDSLGKSTHPLFIHPFSIQFSAYQHTCWLLPVHCPKTHVRSQGRFEQASS